jgi:hypothetical protein
MVGVGSGCAAVALSTQQKNVEFCIVINWKTDRRVHLAIGLAIVFVGAKWLFTGSLLYAAVDMTAKPAEGQTSAGVTFSALLPVLFDLVIGGIIFLGGYAINLADIVFNRARQIVSPDTGQTVAVPPTSSEPLVDSASGMRQAILSLGDAAASNDLESIERLRIQIRKPYALASLSEAYGKGDTAAAAELVAELNKMHDVPAAKRKGGQ